MTVFHRVYGDLRPVAMVSATQHDGSRTASSDAAEPAAAVPSLAAAGASPRGAASTSSDSDDGDHSSPTTAGLGAKRLYTLFHARNAACVVGPALAAYMLLAETRYVESHISVPLFAFQGEKWIRGESFSGRLRSYGNKTFIHTDLHDYMYVAAMF